MGAPADGKAREVRLAEVRARIGRVAGAGPRAATQASRWIRREEVPAGKRGRGRYVYMFVRSLPSA